MNKEEFIQLLENEGAILFGSRAIGGATEDSDYDYLVDFISFHSILGNTSFEVTPSQYYLNSVFININGVRFNIVVYKISDKEAWIGAIEMMKKAPYSIIKNAKYRKLMFEAILAILKQLTE